MKDVDYSVSEFIKDEYFHKWLLDSDPACDEFWNRWIADDEDRIRVVNEAKNILLSISFVEEKLPISEKELVWEGISDVIGKPNKKKNVNWHSIAATVAFILISTAAFLFYNSYQSNDHSNSGIVYIEKRTSEGQKYTIRLMDGTLVKLNSGSKIRFPEKFESDSREVYLEGEAFFEVTKDTSRPFTVISGGIETKVLGTSFNISAYPERENIDVAVVTGKVTVRNTSFQAVGAAKEIMHLTPNKMASFSRTRGDLKKSTFVNEEVLSWKDNIIYFKDADFSDIQLTLEKWYGVRFILEKKIIMKKDFSGRFDNKPLSVVLDGLSYVMNFDYSIDKSTVTIK